MAAYKDLLAALVSYPDRTPKHVVEQAVAVAKVLEAKLSALSFEVEFPPGVNMLVGKILDLDVVIAAERHKSAEQTRALANEFEAAAQRMAVAHQQIVETCLSTEIPEILIDYARLRDMTLVPVGDDSLQRSVAESVIFGSGRPVLVLPAAPAMPTFALDTVAVAWDFSRAAARALGDALPILRRAKSVRLVTIVNEKTIQTKRSRADLVRHLADHGVDAAFDQVDGSGRASGEALQDYCEAHRVDLLVMGAYGHSRMRDFLLGGATKSILARPPCPTFLSH